MSSASSFLTTREVADLFGVTARTIRRSAEAGPLAAIRLSRRGRLLFRRADVEALLDRPCACGAASPAAVEPAGVSAGTPAATTRSAGGPVLDEVA